MRRDGRGSDHRTLDAIRLMAAERVRDGDRPSSVTGSFGVNRATIYRWLVAASKPDVGAQAVRSRPAVGRSRSLTPPREQQVFRRINAPDERQYGLDIGLRTRSVVASLIERKLKIRLGLTAVGASLTKLGPTLQKPSQRSYQRDPEAVEKRQRERLPEIARQAEAVWWRSIFWDEPGSRTDIVHGRTWGRIFQASTIFYTIDHEYRSVK